MNKTLLTLALTDSLLLSIQAQAIHKKVTIYECGWY